MFIKRFLWSMLILTSIVSVVSAQTEACSAVIDAILNNVGEACENLGRNQICYGNDDVTALDFTDAELADFSTVGTVRDIQDIASVNTAPFNVDDNIWGIALLSLQADLPDTLPGQNVTFVVFGDTQLTNQVIPESEIVAFLSAQSTGNANTRSGAGLTFDVIGTLSNGEEITLIGRDLLGDWVEFETENGTAWVFAELLNIDGNLMLLPADGISEDSAPLQAFSLQTGIGQTTCQETPPDGVLVQSPENTTVHFTVNGIEVEIGSTAFLQIDNGDLEISNIEGNVSVTSVGETQLIEVGNWVAISEGEPPGEPSPFDFDDFQYLPVNLLPEEIGIPLLVLSDNIWRDSNVEVEAGDTFVVVAGGIINFWDFCEAQKVANGQPDIDCDSLILPPEGGDPTTITGEPLPSDMSLFPVPSAPAHSLVGRIGTQTFFVGSGGTFTAEESGTLEFRTNDIDNNNVGTFFVAVVPLS
ncbi:MAG: hypothetical protein Phog2KO_37450 [Phototrophicaceae bacterium]